MAVLASFSYWRREETDKLVKLRNGDLGSVNSVNITMLSAGKQHNVIPEIAEATVDIRTCPNFSLNDLESKINEITNRYSGVTWTYFLKHDSSAVSSIDQNDIYWSNIHKSITERYYFIMDITCIYVSF